jgi:hypothetical protein
MRALVSITIAIGVATSAASAAEPKKKTAAKPDGAAASVTVTTPAPAAKVAVEETSFVPTVATEITPEEAPDRPGWSVAGLVGFAAGNGYNSFALGVRGGYTLPFHLYLGGDISVDIFSGALISIAPEVGYDLRIPVGVPLLLRPYFGLGFADVTSGGLGPAFEIYPGAEMLYDLTPHLFVGGDLRVPIVFVNGQVIGQGGTAAIFTLYGTVGYKF